MKFIDKRVRVADMALIKDVMLHLVETGPGMIGLPTDRHANTFSEQLIAS
jgi:hypothetical protein